MPILEHLVQHIINLPRLIRIMMVMIIAIAYVLLFFPLVDLIYVEVFFDSSTVLLPSLVSAAIGGIVYIIGWRIIVNPYKHPTPNPLPIILFISLSLLVLFADILLITMGISMLDSLPPDAVLIPND